MKTLNIMGWLSITASLLSMVIGHSGVHNLHCVSSQISTYAATAPHDNFITTAILLSSLSLLIIGVLVSRHRIFGDTYFAHLVPALSGAAAAGLITLAYYEETANTLSLLKQSGFWAIRAQSFHDAGLTVFFYSSILLVMIIGVLAIVDQESIINKILGGVILIMGPGSYFLMTTHWPKYIGFEGVVIGVNQRAALFCLWLTAALTLVITSKKAFQKSDKQTSRM